MRRAAVLGIAVGILSSAGGIACGGLPSGGAGEAGDAGTSANGSTTDASGTAGDDSSSSGEGTTGGDEVESCPVDEPTDALTVATTRGLVRGHVVDDVIEFLGVPYAAPPVEELRFKPPVAHACWNEPFEAKTYGNVCPQKNLANPLGIKGAEDCLFLNVWTPELAKGAAAEPRPVMFFIHGGAEVLGASNMTIPGAGTSNGQDGRFLARMQGAVVVSVNYRLGALGFMAHDALDAESAHGVSGNYAILDLIFALQWVQDNIARFGGDPSRVMVFGESAGAWNTCTLLASPLASGLFSSALMQSGGCDQPSLAVRKDKAQVVLEKTGCTEADDVAACLRSASLEALVESGDIDLLGGADFDPADPNPMAFGPAVDGYVLPKQPLDAIADGEHNAVPLVAGSNRDEGELFVLHGSVLTCQGYREKLRESFGDEIAAQIEDMYPCSLLNPRSAMVDVISDFMFTCSARRAVRAASRGQSQPVYRYYFTHGRSLGPLVGLFAAHGAEIPFVFHTLGLGTDLATDAELHLAAWMGKYWSNLAAFGNPSIDAPLPWEPYDAERDNAIVLDTELSHIERIASERCDFWDSFID